jgi:archaellum component FlaD/FlaE
MASLIDRLFGRTDEPADEQRGAEMSEEEFDDSSDLVDMPAETESPEDGPVLDDLRARLDELETGVDQNESTMRAVESNQEALAESVDEIHDTIRRLLGVYDQLTAQENPFDAGTPAGNGRFGVVGKPRDDDRGDERSDGAQATDDEHDEADEHDERVTFGDLLEEEAEASQTEPEPEPAVEREREGGMEPEPEPTPAMAEPAAADAESDGSVPIVDQETLRAGHEGTHGEHSGSMQVRTLPRGYATEAVIMEWLATLIMTSGPAGAVKAIAFYEEVGWVGPEVRDRLEEFLSGPGLDEQVDPNCPVELTADDHAESYEYILQLNTLEGITTDFGERA